MFFFLGRPQIQFYLSLRERMKECEQRMKENNVAFVAITKAKKKTPANSRHETDVKESTKHKKAFSYRPQGENHPSL
jgi:hypothetical protein